MSNAKVQIVKLKSEPVYQPLLGDKIKTCGMRSGRVYLRSSESCGRHSTGNHEEMLIFLSGNGTALIGKKGRPVGKGKVCYIPPYTFHNIKNTGTEPLVYIYCVAPATSSKGNSEQHGHNH